MGTQARQYPDLPPSVPPLGDAKFLRAAGRLVLRSRSDWKVLGPMPDVPKAVLIAAPHSSNWDGILGIAAAFAIGIRPSWMGKHTLFRWPVKRLMVALGGIATERESAHGAVEQMTEQMRRAERMWIMLAPEGTRRKVAKWRTGFWHIAHNAQVPIIPAYIDYPSKTFGFGPPMATTGDIQADFQKLMAFYAPYRGKNGKTAIPGAP